VGGEEDGDVFVDAVHGAGAGVRNGDAGRVSLAVPRAALPPLPAVDASAPLEPLGGPDVDPRQGEADAYEYEEGEFEDEAYDGAPVRPARRRQRAVPSATAAPEPEPEPEPEPDDHDDAYEDEDYGQSEEV